MTTDWRCRSIRQVKTKECGKMQSEIDISSVKPGDSNTGRNRTMCKKLYNQSMWSRNACSLAGDPMQYMAGMHEKGPIQRKVVCRDYRRNHYKFPGTFILQSHGKKRNRWMQPPKTVFDVYWFIPLSSVLWSLLLYLFVYQCLYHAQDINNLSTSYSVVMLPYSHTHDIYLFLNDSTGDKFQVDL